MAETQHDTAAEMEPDPGEDGLGINAEALARAEAIVATMSASFAVNARQDLSLLRKAFVAAQAADGGDRTEHMTAVYRKAHEFKGMGATFGYPLITRVGASLCRYLKGLDDAAQANDAVVAAHVDAIAALLVEDVSDEDDPDGARLAAGLEGLVAHV